MTKPALGSNGVLSRCGGTPVCFGFGVREDRARVRPVDSDAAQYWLTRLCFQRSLAFLYLIAFLIAANQFLPLAGAHGIMPARDFLRQVSFLEAPGLGWLWSSDRAFTAIIWTGLALAVFALSGFSERFGIWVSAATWLLLWVLYSSVVNAGGIFYGFGWEILLLETGFLAIFLGSREVRAPAVVMWLILWVAFRVMFGAGLIKMRGDSCWRDLTCMYFHYETQPLPNPLSWYFHHLPRWMHRGEVLYNHFVELVAPFAFFAPRPICYVAGGADCTISGGADPERKSVVAELSDAVICLPCFDDRLLGRILHVTPPPLRRDSTAQQVTVAVLAILIGVLSFRRC